MRSLTRIGVAVTAAALASATALAGAGLANAQFTGDSGSVAADGFTTRSASTIVSERTEGGVDVTYANKTDRSLGCFGLSAPTQAIEVFDAHVKRYGAKSLTDTAGARLQAKLDAVGGAEMADKVFALSYDGTVTGGGIDLDGGMFGVLIGGGESATWEVPAPAGYAAGALLVCAEPNAGYEDQDDMPFSYVEYVSTTMTGGVLGSLDVFGSLGSLGS